MFATIVQLIADWRQGAVKYAAACREPSAPPRGRLRLPSDGRGSCRRRPRAARPSRARARTRAESSDTPAPTAWMPRITWLSARATTRTKPSSACIVMRAAVGAEREKSDQDLAMRRLGGLGREADRDDLRIGEADRGIATRSKARFSPAMISATISPCAIARCASIGSPARSPIAQTLRIEVAQWSSTRTNGPAIVRSSVSRPKPLVTRGVRPRPAPCRRQPSSRRRPRRRPKRALGEPQRSRAEHVSTPRSARRRATGCVSSAS